MNMPDEQVISCPEGQTFIAMKQGLPYCGYPSSHQHIIYDVVFAGMTVFVWLAVLFAIAKFLDRKSGLFRRSGSPDVGGSSFFLLINIVTLLVMFGIYRLLNYGFGLDF